jgi:sorbitol/mannitol transport system substrate-binding protein
MHTTPHRWRRLLAILFAFVMFAAACGGSDGAESADDAPAASDSDSSSSSSDDDGAMDEDEGAMDDEEPAPTPEPVEIDASTVISDECSIPDPADEVEIDIIGWEFPIVTQYADEFEDCEDGNYAFNYQFLDSQAAREQMTLDASTGSPEFELYQGSNAFIIELANQGYLMPLNDLIAKYGDEYGLTEIDQAFFDFASIDGNVYAIPAVSNTMHVFYNEPALADIGVDVPTTFAEALDACPTIQAAGYDIGFLYMLSAGWAWQIEFDSVLGSLGKTNIDPVTGAPQFNSAEGIEAANILKDMHDVCGGGAAGTYSTDDVQAAFQTGEAILGHTWASRAAAMDDEEASTEVGNIQFAPALSSGGGVLAAPAYIDGWGIPVGTPADKIDEIFLAIMGATDRESQEAAAEFGLVTRSGVTNPNGPRDGAAAEASLVNGRGPDLAHPAAGIARAKLGEALVTILDGTDPADALAAAEEAYLAEAGDQGLLGDAGGDDESAAAPAASFDEVISDECAIPPVDGFELDVIGWEFPIVTQYAEELEECEDGGYELSYQFLDSTAAREQMTLDASTGSPEFELYQGSNAFIIELANQGYLRPLNDMIEKYSSTFGLDEIDQAFFDFASIDGQIYSVPMVSNTMHLFYNETEMNNLGLEVPTTFAEAFETCAAIQDAGYDIGFLYMLSAGWAWQIEFDSVLGANGLDPIDPVSGQPNFNSPEGIEAANLLKQMHDDCGGGAAGTYSTDDVQAAFQTGEAILGHTWASRAAAMDDPEASTVVGDMQFAPALATTGDVLAAPAYIDGWGIPAGTSEDKVEAIFLAMMAATDRESQEAAAEFGLVTRDGVTNAAGPRDGAAAAASLVNGRGPDLTHPAAGIARAKLGEALITILDGTDPADALAAAEEAYLAEAGEQGLL